MTADIRLSRGFYHTSYLTRCWTTSQADCSFHNMTKKLATCVVITGGRSATLRDGVITFTCKLYQRRLSQQS